LFFCLYYVVSFYRFLEMEIWFFLFCVFWWTDDMHDIAYRLKVQIPKTTKFSGRLKFQKLKFEGSNPETSLDRQYLWVWLSTTSVDRFYSLLSKKRSKVKNQMSDYIPSYCTKLIKYIQYQLKNTIWITSFEFECVYWLFLVVRPTESSYE
jgi:hypothetical protein